MTGVRDDAGESSHERELDPKESGRLRWSGVYPKHAAHRRRPGSVAQTGPIRWRILEHHLDLNMRDLEAAWAYYLQQPEEIEEVIREDEEV